MPSDEQITEIEDAATARAKSPHNSTATDGLSATYRPAAEMLDDLEAIERREKRVAAAAQPHFGMRFTKLTPPGCG